MAMAPQSIVTALTGATIVLVQVFAPWVLGETVTHLDWVATVIIVAGVCVWCVGFGGMGPGAVP